MSKLVLSDKLFIVKLYQEHRNTITELANKHNVSRRTISRILYEAGAVLPVARARAELHEIKKILSAHHLETYNLDSALRGIFNADTTIKYLQTCSISKFTYIIDKVNQERSKASNQSAKQKSP